MQDIRNKNILLIISGGIAAYKTLELIRLLRKAGAQVKCVLTAGGAQFVTPLSVAALSEQPVYTDLWSLKDETEMGHIRLSREADLILVAPASANIIAGMAHGFADDLARAVLLAADKPVMVAPAMNSMMWQHKATQENIETLRRRGIMICGPDQGMMACGESGEGRMSEPGSLYSAIAQHFQSHNLLSGYRALVTSGPTYEPLDPVRFIGNRSSGKQGHAIAQVLADKGAAVTLITGPVALPDPDGVTTVHVETAAQMLDACEEVLPADIAVCAAAVSDWRSDSCKGHKIKKQPGHDPAPVTLTENPDILSTIARHDTHRPALVIGFAAETDDVLAHATEKRARKNCDWILANQVAGTGPDTVFGSDHNHVYLVNGEHAIEWPKDTKAAIAARLTDEIIEFFAQHNNKSNIKNAAA